MDKDYIALAPTETHRELIRAIIDMTDGQCAKFLEALKAGKEA